MSSPATFETALALVKENGLLLATLDDCFKRNKDIVLAAVQQHGKALEFADMTLKQDHEVVLAAVSQRWSALYHADWSLRDDREIVMAAVCQDGKSLQYASGTLKKDFDLVLAAVQQDGEALWFADASLKGNPEVVLAAVQQTGRALRLADASLRSDFLTVLAAIQQAPASMAFACGACGVDRELLFEALRRGCAWYQLNADQRFVLLQALKEAGVEGSLPNEAAQLIPFALHGGAGIVACLEEVKLEEADGHVHFSGYLGLGGQRMCGWIPAEAKVKDLGERIRSFNPVRATSGEDPALAAPYIHLILPDDRPVELFESWRPVMSLCQSH
mmetsp:Transcript_63827/g.138776  ORF Transcript_63827/g.138776 Transcript_63827/m.138776 type:complete len:331 (-) Transcript_63827:49-1041(-)